MGQKVNPNGLRIGIIKDWSSRWYANKKDYSKYLLVDLKIRTYLEPKLEEALLSHIDIERIKGMITVSIFVARPGVVVGQDGNNIKLLKAALLKLIGVEDIKINVIEIRNPDLDATLVAKSIAKQLEERASFRITQKKAIQRVMKAGAKGCKTMVKGRVGGAEIARTEQYREGVLSLHTLTQNIDYGFTEAKTTYGRLGVKVWISMPANVGSNTLAPGEKRNTRDRFDRRNNFGGQHHPYQGHDFHATDTQGKSVAPAPTPVVTAEPATNETKGE
jgi:small subunit ribosomal protein S3